VNFSVTGRKNQLGDIISVQVGKHGRTDAVSADSLRKAAHHVGIAVQKQAPAGFCDALQVVGTRTRTMNVKRFGSLLPSSPASGPLTPFGIMPASHFWSIVASVPSYPPVLTAER
jgi:hypothetical protein